MIKYYGDTTRWFLGTVININDPLEVGRVKVRIYGLHNDNILSEDLPWAQVITPITEGGTTGLGGILGVKPDAQVFGIFLDGQNSQLPLILGSMPKLEDTAAGGRTTNILARGSLANDHPSRVFRDENQKDLNGNYLTYSTATAPRLSAINEKAEAFYGNDDWSEPLVAGGTIPFYPFNLVKETEGGHVEEFDDTPGAKRYQRYHPSGSFEEILDDGTRTIKITGEDYEMLLDGKNVYVNGNLNLTVTGNKRELIQGNYHLEVEGDMTMNLHQSLQTKVEMNQETEVNGYRVTSVVEDDNLSVMLGNQNINVFAGSRTDFIGENLRTTINGNVTTTNYGTNSLISVGNASITVSNGTLTTTSSGVITLETTSNMVIDVDGTKTETIGGTHTLTSPTAALTYDNGTITVTGGDVVASGISLNSHVHSGVLAGGANTGGPV
jgi:hypothetical protein